MTYPDVIAEGRTSITDRDDWRDFCARAAADLSLIQPGEPVLEWALDGVALAENRYGDLADRLETLFGPWEGWHIVEVGGGYGGQACFLLDCYPCTYWIYDLPEPMALQHAYLAAHGRSLEDNGVGDLFLSNYALSEGTREMQQDYLEFAAEFPRGYITWNGWTHDTFSPDEFGAFIPLHQWIHELPHPNADSRNRCLVWGLK